MAQAVTVGSGPTRWYCSDRCATTDHGYDRWVHGAYKEAPPSLPCRACGRDTTQG